MNDLYGMTPLGFWRMRTKHHHKAALARQKRAKAQRLIREADDLQELARDLREVAECGTFVNGTIVVHRPWDDGSYDAMGSHLSARAYPSAYTKGETWGVKISDMSKPHYHRREWFCGAHHTEAEARRIAVDWCSTGKVTYVEYDGKTVTVTKKDLR